jgi:DNA modification methylase
MAKTQNGPMAHAQVRSNIVMRRVADLRPYSRNARTHSKQQVAQIAASIRRFGFTNPVLTWGNGEIIAGHGRVEAAKQLGLAEVPTLALDHLSAAERRAYVLADNQLALNAGWDQELLAGELQALIDIEFEIGVLGFSQAEIDKVLDQAAQSSVVPPNANSAIAEIDDAVPAVLAQPVTRMGDVWQLGRHRLICADARLPQSYVRLLGDDRVDLVFTDPPYNVPIDGHVTGLGAVKHREFAFASGELSQTQFTAFLSESLGAMATCCRDGAIAFVCMDWRHMRELLAAGYAVFSELKNVCVWNKTNGGMGAFYRSKHEMVFVWKVGTAPHTNNFGLGDTGRYRTNVWDYAGISSISATRQAELEMHPTVKPVALVADAIRDCSRRGDIVLDGFGGSGTTLIAAEKTGRTARLIEYDPSYCDTILRRYFACTGKQPGLAMDGTVEAHSPQSAKASGTPVQTFEEVAEHRGVQLPDRSPEPALRAVRHAGRGTAKTRGARQ